MLQYELAMASALNDRARNLYGRYGPRHELCSGLGQIFHLPYPGGRSTKSPSKCACHGSGVDVELLMRRQISDMVQRMEALERKELERARRRAGSADWIKKGPNGKASRQMWEELLSWATADATAVANTTDETILFPNIVIPANYLQDGRVLRGTATGKLSTTGTPTITFAIRWGGVAGTLLATTEPITNGSGVSNVNWRVEYEIQTRTNGASGTLLVAGKAFVHTAAATVVTNIFGVSGFDAPAQVTADLTADTSLSLTADWAVASSSNTATGMLYLLESLN